MDLAGGIQEHMGLKIFWIPSQARNDKKSKNSVFFNCNTVSFAGLTTRGKQRRIGPKRELNGRH